MGLKVEADGSVTHSRHEVGKRPYAPPTLTQYGRVADLTQAGSSGAQEGNKPHGCGQLDKPRACNSSDIRAKQDILRMGTHPTGVELYLYRYRPPFADDYGGGMYLGVMAQELLPVLPEAVSIDAQGYYAVDYGVLAAARFQA